MLHAHKDCVLVFNVSADLTEHHDRALERPADFLRLLNELKKVSGTAIQPSNQRARGCGGLIVAFMGHGWSCNGKHSMVFPIPQYW